MRNLNRIVPALAVVGLLGACAGGSRGKAISAADIDQDAMMAKMMELAQPNEHHAHLAQFAGDWDVTMTYVDAPGDAPEEMKGSAKIEMILDGHYLRQHFSGDFEGMPFQGQSTSGYDNNKGEYFSFWMDNMSTAPLPHTTGQCSEDGRKLVLTSEYDNPVLGVLQSVTETWEVQDINHWTFFMRTSWKGQSEFESMRISYSRK